MRMRQVFGAGLVAAVVVLAVPAVSGASGGARSGNERFTLVFTSETGPGSIFARGVFNAGGTDYQGKVDEAVFPDGTFKIFHSAIHTAVTFDATTCTGRLSGSGPYRLGNGYGAYAKIKGTGTARLKGSIATGRKANGTCDFHDVSAFSLTVHARGPVSF